MAAIHVSVPAGLVAKKAPEPLGLGGDNGVHAFLGDSTTRDFNVIKYDPKRLTGRVVVNCSNRICNMPHIYYPNSERSASHARPVRRHDE